ncbi:MAG TPA: DUF1223 domain-containing protein [Thermoanaerobaculia bacterium]|nr:DUF1223 domain-containing protein [Thermoanaerobaculia bacterium]
MNAILKLSFLALVLAVLASRGGAGEAPAAGADRTAVVELFTSQGCSSCPPADRLLAKLAHDPQYQGKVIPLSFHVDYWNYIGWQDPFSSARWSDRQKLYGARVFHTNRIYTPQVVVNGRAECVGSEEGQVLGRIGDALRQEPAGRVTLAVDPPTPDGHLRVKVGAKLARAAGSGDLDLWVAVYESGLSTPVKAGENASRVLRNDRVVRRFEKALTLPAAAGAEKSTELVLGIDKRWKVDALGVAAFLQDPATLAIHGAAAREVGR